MQPSDRRREVLRLQRLHDLADADARGLQRRRMSSTVISRSMPPTTLLRRRPDSPQLPVMPGSAIGVSSPP